MSYPITTSDFKAFFTRDFDFGNCGDPSKVSDQDIERAMDEASMNFNADVLPDDKTRRIIFSYLTAYYLKIDVDNASSNGASSNVGILTYRQARNVAESFKVPKWIEENPVFSQFSQN